MARGIMDTLTNRLVDMRKDDNPYIKAFFEWWDKQLHSTVHTLRLTGGEPLMHRHVWKMMDFLKSRTKCC